MPEIIQATIDRSQHTVLVVDDNPATRYSTARLLRGAGFRTQEAGSGREAVDLALQGVSGVVLDVHLPDIDGFEVCRILRGRAETTMLPIVHLSAEYVRSEDKITGLDAGADAYLVHPVEPAVLIATMQALIRARVAEEQLELRRRDELEREQAARALAERHNRTKDDFIAVLSHELRTPLNAIMGWVQVLLRRDPTPEARRGLEAIERNVKTQARIISDILDVSRINSGKLQINREPTDPAALVIESIAALRGAIDEKALRVETDVGGAHAPGWLDPARYQQVLWNLMTNAIKFSPRGGEIRVALRREGEELTLVVQDFGRGIAPHFLPHLFDRFSQGDAPETRSHGGLGLGLSIVQHIAELHDGQASAFSAGEGQGATMTVRISVAQPERLMPPPLAEAGASDIAREEPAVRGRDVMVVEDDPDAREMLRIVLEDRGATVRSAADFDAALAVLRERWPDVLVCDIGLSGRDGYELVREVRAMQPAGRPRLPAVALTAFSRAEDREKALAAGFDLHLPKPFKPHLLMAALALLLGGTGA